MRCKYPGLQVGASNPNSLVFITFISIKISSVSLVPANLQLVSIGKCCQFAAMVTLIVRFISAIYAPTWLNAPHRQTSGSCSAHRLLNQLHLVSTQLLIIISQSLQFHLIYGNYALNSIVTKLWWFIHSDSRHRPRTYVRVPERTVGSASVKLFNPPMDQRHRK